MAIGLTDDPAESDDLKVESYYIGLADFVARCPTPMTVALQGGWGTGKTSAMKMIQRHLPKAQGIKVVEFNTWQYSQFDLGDQLVFSLLSAILEKVAPPSKVPASKDLLEKIAVVKRMGMGAAAGVARSLAVMAAGNVGRVAVDAVDGAFEAASEAPPVPELTTRLVDVRSEFSAIVDTYVAGSDGHDGRVVVFIDDLDRLPPRRAIEVMEALKTLFDCPGCVFVLAIDFDVVARGVRDKYGEGMNEAKARAYFDKFIQVPFRMPVAEYNVEELLAVSLAQLGIGTSGTKNFEQLIRLSVGPNPRALKRLLNTFVLLTSVARAKAETDTSREAVPQEDERVFALLALEAAYPGFHDQLRSAADTAGLGDLLLAAAGSPDGKSSPQDPAEWEVEPERTADFRQFAALLKKVLGAEEEVAQALSRTSLTSVGGRGATVVPITEPAQKSQRAMGAGIDGERLRQAGHLEDLLAREVERRGGNFTSALRSKPDWWHWYVSSQGGSRLKPWGQLTFAAGGTIRLYFGSPQWPAEDLARLQRALQDLASRHGWRLETADQGSYFRLHGIGAADDIAELVPLLGECAQLASS